MTYIQMVAALREVRELIPSGSEEMHILDDVLAHLDALRKPSLALDKLRDDVLSTIDEILDNLKVDDDA